MANKTIIGFDFGTTSIGIAIGQDITATASPLTAIKVRNKKLNWSEIKKILEDWQPKLAIIGLPLNMDGTEQITSIQARKFAKILHKKFNIQVKLHDERLSTIEAREMLFNHGGHTFLNKSKIDSISAVIILESWFKKSI